MFSHLRCGKALGGVEREQPLEQVQLRGVAPGEQLGQVHRLAGLELYVVGQSRGARPVLRGGGAEDVEYPAQLLQVRVA